MNRILHGTLLSLALVDLTGCSEPKDQIGVNPEPPPSTAPTGSAAAKVEPPPTPTLGLVPVQRKELGDDVDLFPVDEALLIAQGHRVGRLTKEGLESVGEIPKGNPAYGDNIIDSVEGHYPDALDVVFRTSHGRAPAPTYAALTGEGLSSTFSPGGGMGWISGIARVSESTLIHGYSNIEGHRIITVRGPAVLRTPTTLKEAGCTDEEVMPNEYMPTPPAVEPYVFGSTAAGTVIALGSLCRERGPAAEVWDAKGGKPKITKLGEWIEDVGFLTAILRGKGDLLWLAESGGRIVQMDKGEFSVLPAMKRKQLDAFVSPDGVLHASDGRTIYRYDGSGWVDVAHLAWFTEFDAIALWEGVFWATVNGRLFQLEPTESLAFQDGCKTPFVYLYDVSSLSEPNFTFPTTRKALSTFAGLKDLSLVDFRQQTRRLGIIVPSREVGEAVVAHVKKTMKDEDPVLICYRPKDERKIPLTP